MAIQNHQQHQRPHSTRSITQPLPVPLPNRSQQGSTIIYLRERFGTGAEQAAAPATQTETGNPKSPRDTAESSSNNVNVGSSSTRNRPNENSSRRGTPMTDQNAPSVDNSVPPRSKTQAEVTDDGNHQATCTSNQQNPTPGVVEKSISHRSKVPEGVNEDTHHQEASTSTSANKQQKITKKAEEPVSQRKECENVTADALRQESSTSSSKQQSEIPVEMSVSHKCRVFEDACTKKVSDDVTEEAHHQESSTSKQRQNRTASRVDKSMSHRIKVGDEETHHQEVSSTSDEQLSKALAENLVSHSHRSKVREDVIEDTRHKEISAGEEQNALSVKSSVSVSHTSKVQEDVIQCNRPQEETSTSNKHKEAHHEVKSSSSHTSAVHEKIQTTTSSDAMWQGASTEDKNFTQQESIGTAAPPINDRDEIEMEETEGDDQYYEETSYDWFSDISRPRSYWEDKRQAWYQEMLSTSSDNNEIRQLLERRTVSNFLSSDLREKMDQLMVSRAQIQISPADEELDGEDNQERMGQLLLSFLQRHSHNVAGRGSQEDQREEEVDRGGRGREEEDDDDEDEEEEEEYGQEAIREEEEGSANHQYIEATEYFDQTSTSMHSPSPFRSWTYSDRQEEGYDDGSEHASINPMHIPLPSQASNQDVPQCASTGHPSIEMVLIYNLRGHMAQLQREMTELRKSLQACMEMQTKMQYYFLNQQGGVHPAGEARNLVDKTPRKRICCVCYEAPVDSFLYRCGHMCTCLKCANELQWSSGKCPICRAPILDVVRAYRDS